MENIIDKGGFDVYLLDRKVIDVLMALDEKNSALTGQILWSGFRKTTVCKEYSHPELEWAKDSRLIMLTAHRRENLGMPMHHMFRAIRKIMEEHEDVKVIYPIHMNPVVRQTAEEELGGCDRIRIIESLNVLDFHNFLSRSFMILTDSGGIQEEAPSLGKPVLVMRDTTERPEGIAAGTLKLVGTDEEVIYQILKNFLKTKLHITGWHVPVIRMGMGWHLKELRIFWNLGLQAYNIWRV